MIGLYSPDTPPVPGGVSDHTLVLARALEAQGHPPVVLGGRGDPALFAPLACRTGVTPLTLAAAARELGVTALLVQYVPFLFARRGVSPAICRGVSLVKREGVRVAVFVHEPYVPFTRLPWLVTGWPMRWQLRFILRRAAFAYAPVPRFVEIAQRYARPETSVRLAPVGATLPVARESRAQARQALGLADGTIAIGVFSPAAAGLLLDWVDRARAALEDRADVVWVCFGFGSERLPRETGSGDRLLRVADHEPGAVARTMRALDLAAQPYVDGLTMRRTSAMLALAHGVALVSSTGPLFDPRLAALAACEDTAEVFAARLVRLVDDAGERAALTARSAGYAELASV
ncbi:MAG TPA: hypothetical protein VMT21_09575, partial [Gemmatimonadales bacterium]|nr:hypothetical protein [Gemmatimonadales bacterium]